MANLPKGSDAKLKGLTVKTNGCQLPNGETYKNDDFSKALFL